MKRFYKSAAAIREGDLYLIALDGKRVRTPQGKPLALPSPALADAVAAEWLTQGEIIQPKTMHLTAIANAAIDRIAPTRAAMIAGLMRFAQTDLLCHRAEAPADLVARESFVWQPVLDWAEAHHGIALAVTAGIVAVEQPAASLAAAERLIAGYDDLRLAALSTAVSATGSLILGIALAERHLSAAEAHAAAQLDETYQNEKWGEDEEAAAHRAELKADIEAAGAVFRLLSA
jgi:chaperone required for assembly of F1-ATPase